MSHNDLQKQLKRYFHQINRQLPCPRQERKRYLSSLKNSISEYVEEHPQCTMEDVWEQLGTVPDLADNYISAENTLNYMKKRRRLQIMVALLTACTVTCVSLFAIFLYTAKKNSVTKIEITIETSEAATEE